MWFSNPNEWKSKATGQQGPLEGPWTYLHLLSGSFRCLQLCRLWVSNYFHMDIITYSFSFAQIPPGRIWTSLGIRSSRRYSTWQLCLQGRPGGCRWVDVLVLSPNISRAQPFVGLISKAYCNLRDRKIGNSSAKVLRWSLRAYLWFHIPSRWFRSNDAEHFISDIFAVSLILPSGRCYIRLY